MFLISLIMSCKKREPQEYRTFYRAINGKDTALLIIGTNKERFFGNYQIYHGSRAIKDSGVVDGEISGDTLRGKFKYRTYGGGVTTIPVIFLKHNDKLITGKGVPITLFGLIHFSPEYPIDFKNPEFVFSKINKNDLDKSEYQTKSSLEQN
ncbi:hypothetical protein EM308_01735 [Flavobacterium gilvum]|uniref:Uncharacterized protein n=2 Tax=Flavobacterium gilvum TaxID=1492737 RepID=A0AAC9I6S8_9FLAO|nr:hypothetical protein EM308_01735 [Flavobacterium gilvum]